MAEYIEREELIRQITCNMVEFIGTPDDVQKHDEQCNYAICMIEDAPVADVAPVVHGRWEEYLIPNILCCSNCDWGIDPLCKSPYCPNCGVKMDIKDGGNNDAESID